MGDLKKNDERNLAIWDALPDTVLLLSKDGIVLDAKPSGDSDFFKDPKNVVGKSVNELMPADIADIYLYYIQMVFKKPELKQCEYKLKLGEAIQDFEARFIVCGADEVLVLVRKITQRKSAEEQLVKMIVQLEESQDNLTSILNQLRIGAAMTEDNGNLNFVSQSARQILGLTGELLGRSWREIFPFSEQEKYQIENMSAIAPRKRVKIPVKILQSDENGWIDIEIQDHPQDPEKKIFLFYDVTEVHTLRRMLGEKTEFCGMIGQSDSMRQVFSQIRELADLDVSVVIEGETGTGKELVARALHQLSGRKNRSFIAVNCAGLTTGSLLASQLFGHRRGAFTGAIDDQKGLIEAADGGTLFLDEIGDIPADVQMSLLRFLQEKEIVRVGESHARKVNVRIIAASQHNLIEAVQQGRFRSDLYYRIHVASVLLPPLRDRREDIPQLATAFLEKAGVSTAKKVARVGKEAMQFLIQQSWPGNVRELQGAIESAVIRSRGSELSVDDFPPALRVGIGLVAKPNERERVMAALQQTRGNRSEAARLLGMSRATFYRRLTDFHIES